MRKLSLSSATFAVLGTVLVGGGYTALAESVSVTEGSQTLTADADTTARYFRITCTKTNPWETTNANGTWGLTFFGPTKDGELVAYPETATAEGSNGTDASVVLNTSREASSQWQQPMGTILTIDAGEELTFNGYSWGPPVISTGRAPYDFTIEISKDGSEWFLWEDRKGAMSAGWGVSDGKGDYAPRTDAQPVANMMPIFDAADTVSVADGATLVLDHVNGRIPNLSGAGTLRVEGGHIILTGTCTFTGTIEGWGYVDFATENDTLSLSFATTAFLVTNLDKARTWNVTGFLPEVRDSASAPLSLVLSGEVKRLAVPKKVITTYGDTVSPAALHGKTTFNDATVETLSGAPRIARFVRYQTTKGLSGVHTIGEVELRLGGVRQAPSANSYCFQNFFATTNFTQGMISSQAIWGNRTSGNVGNLMDGDPDTYFQKSGTGNADEPYGEVDLATPIPFDTVAVFVPSNEAVPNGAHLPLQWIVETSADGWTWTRAQDQDTDYDVGTWPYTRGEFTDDPVKEIAAWPKGAVEVEGGAFEAKNALTKLKLTVTGLSGTGGDNVGTFLSFGEMQLLSGETWQAWPTGTSAAWSDGNTSNATITNICNSFGAFDSDASNWKNYETNTANDYNKPVQRNYSSTDEVAQGVGFIITSPSDLTFDTYTLYMDANWDAYNRVPNVWTLSASFDGENWATIDSCSDGYAIYKTRSGWAFDHFFYKGAVDFSSLTAIADTDLLNDDETVTVAAGATLAVHSARETVGRLEGAGAVTLSGHSPALILKGTSFSGSVTGSGELVFEAGSHVLNAANLAGVTKITLKAGATVSGSATFGGGDLTLVSEGGAWAADCSGIGAFTLSGEALVLPRLETDAANEVSRTPFAYASTDDASKALFRASTVSGFARNVRVSVDADDAKMTLRVAPNGLFLIIR